MDYPLAVDFGQGIAELREDIQSIRDAKAIHAGEPPKRLAIHTFHHQIWPAIVIAGLLDRNHTRMTDQSRSIRFIPQHLPHILRIEVIIRDRLDDHRAGGG